MAEFDLVIRNGAVATAAETMRCDVGIAGDKIVAMQRLVDAKDPSYRN